MNILKKWLNKPSSLDKWSIAYIDVNPFRLQNMSKRLEESGIETKVFEDGIYVRDEQYQEAMGVIR
ncbi:hypothetical protein [Ammoniphilus resinae]|uniref:Alpha-galactosidase n=1 Tax=Ammoniphilus resinae TaxID=861532 RepID=A0ABS4GSX1_9BACL|nr:hypothetical protein [Ammoniphilus resinae]MBP1933379.1 alpha-galactosidase [Ammoniphilus resinae]